MFSREKVILVDKEDNELGLMEKMQAHKEGKLHRAFSVFVCRELDGKLEFLLQQRSKGKYHCGGLWTNTCCSHPRSKEDVVSAAKRRLQEEMGFSCDLYLINNFYYRADLGNGLIEHEFDHVLVGKVTTIDVNINKEEVESYKWMTLTDIKTWLWAEPEEFTPWFRLALLSLEQKTPEVEAQLSISLS